MYNAHNRNSTYTCTPSQVAHKLTKSSSVQNYSEFHHQHQPNSPQSHVKSRFPSPTPHNCNYHSSPQNSFPYNSTNPSTNSATPLFSSVSYSREQDYFVNPPSTQTFVTTSHTFGASGAGVSQFYQHENQNHSNPKTNTSSSSSSASQIKNQYQSLKQQQNCLIPASNTMQENHLALTMDGMLDPMASAVMQKSPNVEDGKILDVMGSAQMRNSIANNNNAIANRNSVYRYSACVSETVSMFMK